MDIVPAPLHVVHDADRGESIEGLVIDFSDWTHEEMRQLLARSQDANGWNEPGMEDYDHYDQHRQ